MEKIVKLSLELQPDSSYQVQLVEIKVEGNDQEILAEGILGKLPNCEKVYQHYQLWQEAYQQLTGTFQNLHQEQQWQSVDIKTQLDWMLRQLRFRENDPIVPNISSENCRELINKIHSLLNEWLDCQEFQKIENTICTHLNNFDEARIIIKTQDLKLCQLPWGLWDLFENYRNAEVVFSPLNFREIERKIVNTPQKNVRILALFGDKTGIDYQKDQEDIKKLALVGAKPFIIEEPPLRDVSSLLWEKKWDIFFFAGHSESHPDKTTGKLYINSKGDSLTPEEFKNTLKNARENGLKIAFLNSCDGLGLAQQLIKECQLPLVIAMREPVPNIVAQQFLKYFLLEYAYHGKPLYVAVRKAKERISDELNKLLPGLDWLPVIYQNPAFHPPKWNDLHRQVSAQQAVLTSLACTALVIACRLLGLLQPMELSAYDQLIRLRPAEPKDERILIVTVDEEDIQYQIEKGIKFYGSLSDEALNQLLTKLLPHQPRVIGSDIYHDFPFEPKLVKTLQPLAEFIGICKTGESKRDRSVISPPPDLPYQQVGFSDVPIDPDHFIRRQFFGMASNDLCPTSYAFSLRVAQQYLEQENYVMKRTSENDREIGNVVFKRLKSDTGAYQFQRTDDANGFQILLNYRAGTEPFESIPLQEILKGSLDDQLTQLIKDRIILIGVTLQNEDEHPTPYTIGLGGEKMFGVFIHAHMISQIISAVKDQRPLLWSWSEEGEMIWIGFWSLTGGILAWWFRSPVSFSIAATFCFLTLFGVCFLLLPLGGWIPLIPPILAFGFTGSCLMYKPLKY